VSHAKIDALFAHPLHQPALAAKQSQTLLEFHHDAGTRQKRFEDGNARGELQAPGRQTVERFSARLRIVRQVVREQCCPQHEGTLWNDAPRSDGSGVAGAA
jgi:hypothetical protein